MQSRTFQREILARADLAEVYWYVECRVSGKEYPLLLDGAIHVVPVGTDPSASRKVADMMRVLHASLTGAHTTWVALVHKESLIGHNVVDFYESPVDIPVSEEYNSLG